MQMRIYEENAASTEWNIGAVCKSGARGGDGRGKRIPGKTCGRPRLGVKRSRARRILAGAIGGRCRAKILGHGLAIKRGSAVELQVVFAFQDVIEQADPSPDARLALARRVPRESESWRAIVFVGKIHPARSPRISGK